VPPFDLNLVDPSPDTLARTMTQAVETANKRCRVGKMSVEVGEYHRFANKDFAGNPEGVRLWLAERGEVDTYPADVRATLLGLAWWTDPLGRRRVRVAGRRLEPGNESPAHRFGPPGERWPALCYLDPEHMVLRTLPRRKPELIAVCGCGAVGSPAELGWVGGSCGPCHDHREEHGTPLRAGDGPVVLRGEGRIAHVAFSPSGRTVVGVLREPPERYGPPGKVCFWERATGKLLQEHGHDFYMGSAETPFAAAGRTCVADGYTECFAWDLETGRVTGDSDAANLSFLALAPDGSTLAGVAPGRHVLVRDLRAGTPWQDHPTYQQDEADGALAFSPDGKTLAVAVSGWRCELVDWDTGSARTLAPPEPGIDDQCIQALAFSPDGALLATGSGRSQEFELITDNPGIIIAAENDAGEDLVLALTSHVYLYDVNKSTLLARFEVAGEVCAVAFTPDGQFLLHAGADRLVHFIDVYSRKERAVLAGPLGSVQCLAFSPDGTTLAVGGGDGVIRFWPWRQLLDRPAPRTRAR
jgi:hypothetical protein